MKWIGSEIVSLSTQHIPIRRVDEQVGEIVVDFLSSGHADRPGCCAANGARAADAI